MDERQKTGIYKGHEITVAERTEIALRLREAAWTYREIGKELEVHHSVVYKNIMDAIDRQNKENDEEAAKLIAIEMARLDEALKAIYPAVKEGDLPSIDRLIRIQDRRARYKGLDAPAKSEVDHKQPLPVRIMPAPENIDESDKIDV